MSSRARITVALVGLLVLVVLGWLAQQCGVGEWSGASVIDSAFVGSPLTFSWAIG